MSFVVLYLIFNVYVKSITMFDAFSLEHHFNGFSYSQFAYKTLKLSQDLDLFRTVRFSILRMMLGFRDPRSVWHFSLKKWLQK